MKVRRESRMDAVKASPRDYLSVEDRREQLLDAALDVLRTGGSDALTMRAVAAQAAVVHGVVHYAFGSRAGLVEALLTREAERALSPLWAQPLREDSLAAAVRAALSDYLEDVRADPARHRAISQLELQSRSSPELAPALAAVDTGLREATAALVADWSARTGRALRLPATTLADAILVTAGGIASWWHSGADDTDAAAVLDLLCRGFEDAAA